MRRTLATTRRTSNRTSQPSPLSNAPGSIKAPIATKNRTAKTSRNGSNRSRASLASWLSLMARPDTKAARARGVPKKRAPTPAGGGAEGGGGNVPPAPPRHVLQDAPAKQHVVGRGVGGASPAACDVD